MRKKRTHETVVYYESLPKSIESLAFYAGWWLTFANQKPVFVQLATVYRQYGKAVSDNFFRRVRDYITKYAHTSALAINRLVSMLLGLLTEVFKDGQQLELLQDPTEMHAFFVYAHGIEQQRRIKNRQDMEAFSRQWTAMMHIVEEVFIANEILPEKLYESPLVS